MVQIAESSLELKIIANVLVFMRQLKFTRLSVKYQITFIGARNTLDW